MPTYEYACKACGNRFEAWQKITDEPLTECPKCHAEIHRVLFPAGVVFKGSGFYSTDNRGHKSGGATTGDHTHDGATEGATESKSDTAAQSTGATKGESSAPKSPEAKSTESKPTESKPTETAKAS
jgi:putative FmdB family regulatory protein